ncbi:unnamed protein product [Phytophthora fragariaefolia]|uniref:Unnamed protein product n=1 Tax=Phytophthora fragariaefolia TaxID=1490495 RepID=A0A9W6YLU6_9STRA|nr:unnamed protein product [Phytophthora fragariaefolia]
MCVQSTYSSNQRVVVLDRFGLTGSGTSRLVQCAMDRLPCKIKQASRVWNETFDEYVRSIGFRVSSYDPCLYIKVIYGEWVLLLVYVDDVLVTGSSADLIAEVKRQLKSRFEMTDSGKCSFILGWSTTRMAMWH